MQKTIINFAKNLIKNFESSQNQQVIIYLLAELNNVGGKKIKKVTTEKAKNPGRQEWGRILGKMIKREKTQTARSRKKKSPVRLGYSLAILPFIAVIIGAIYFYSRKKNVYVQEVPKEVQNAKPQFSDF